MLPIDVVPEEFNDAPEQQIVEITDVELKLNPIQQYLVHTMANRAVFVEHSDLSCD